MRGHMLQILLSSAFQYRQLQINNIDEDRPQSLFLLKIIKLRMGNRRPRLRIHFFKLLGYLRIT